MKEAGIRREWGERRGETSTRRAYVTTTESPCRWYTKRQCAVGVAGREDYIPQRFVVRRRHRLGLGLVWLALYIPAGRGRKEACDLHLLQQLNGLLHGEWCPTRRNHLTLQVRLQCSCLCCLCCRLCGFIYVQYMRRGLAENCMMDEHWLRPQLRRIRLPPIGKPCIFSMARSASALRTNCTKPQCFPTGTFTWDLLENY
jgi:hypothetical protein